MQQTSSFGNARNRVGHWRLHGVLRGIAMRRAILIAVALSCFVSTEEAAAQSSEMTFTGAQLVTACTTADHEWIGFCNGYLQAAFDATGGRICAPKGITRNQVFDIVLPQLMNTTDLQKLNAFVAMDVLLHKAFPCN